MIAWLIALPVLVGAFAVTRRLLRRRGRGVLRAILAVDAALFAGALALLLVALSGGAAQAQTATAAAQGSGSSSAAFIGAAIAVAGASIGAAIAVAYTGAAALAARWWRDPWAWRSAFISTTIAQGLWPPSSAQSSF